MLSHPFSVPLPGFRLRKALRLSLSTSFFPQSLAAILSFFLRFRGNYRFRLITPQMQSEEVGTFFVKEKKPVSRYLEGFFSVKVGKIAEKCFSGRVKFEYVRIRLFRSLKRSLRRYLSKGSFEIAKFPSLSHQSDLIKEKIKLICEQNTALIAAFADPKQGPKVDSGRWRKNCTPFKTYNNKYMADVFSNSILRSVYLLYLELLFAETAPGQLCRHWQMQCCPGAHSADCVEKWRTFRDVLEQEAEIHVNARSVFRQVVREPALCQ